MLVFKDFALFSIDQHKFCVEDGKPGIGIGIPCVLNWKPIVPIITQLQIEKFWSIEVINSAV
jgi:hypothetical protein